MVYSKKHVHYLHGIGSVESQVINGDSLISDSGDRFDIVMTIHHLEKNQAT